MAGVTYFAAMPFLCGEDGELVPSEAQERRTAIAVVREASMAFTAAGAWRSRTGDPAMGDFDDANAIERFAEVPSVDDLSK